MGAPSSEGARLPTRRRKRRPSRMRTGWWKKRLPVRHESRVTGKLGSMALMLKDQRIAESESRTCPQS